MHGARAQGADIILDGVVASSHSNWALSDITPSAWNHLLPFVHYALCVPLYPFHLLYVAARFASAE
jgi:hypothetical protein